MVASHPIVIAGLGPAIQGADERLNIDEAG